MIDPAGFSFETYDAIGRFRTEDEFGNPVDASGGLVTETENVEVDGGVEFSDAVATSEQAAACVARKWATYALGRDLDRPEDACALERLDGELTSSGYHLKDILLKVTESDLFHYRVTARPEGCTP